MPIHKIPIQSLAALVSGLVLGAMVWALSPALTGKVEPWDAEGTYYYVCLLLAGFVAALICPQRFWLAPIGIFIRQFVYALAALPPAPLMALGAAFMALYSLVALAGAAGAFGLMHGFRAARRSRTSNP